MSRIVRMMTFKNVRTRRVSSFSFAWILILSATVAALGQGGRGGINGLVTDPSGAVIPAAKVTALNHATGVEQSTVTTAAGLYSFVSLAPGTYEITATSKGFVGVAQDKVQVSVDQVS